MSEARKLQDLEDIQPETASIAAQIDQLPPLPDKEPLTPAHGKLSPYQESQIPAEIHGAGNNISQRIEKLTSISLIFFIGSLLGFASGVTFAILLLLGAIDSGANWVFSLF